ncbi:4-hydroxybenzoyl-CoA thioesterase [Saccharomonospora sp. CUA-673]|uniref:thioesterase family protein n=1 Tax=Saccharomonospora sp. CUA-673 TaxID=1904969 RepID=UPI00096557B4|nr:thioesterase family protein [Saccharomonospora sp. CUA-673]OLT38526.1 4-hydroxybenzoyl-CoA thioesterase [Saccharomonospora sp. CUA-673]
MQYRDRVRPEWIDYNGHLSEPFYVMVFGFATTNLMDHVGLDETYRGETGCSLYTVEAHVRYLREVGPDADLHVTTFALSVGAKKVRLWHELRVDGDDGDVVATEEIMAIHVSGSRAAPFPDHVADKLRRLLRPAPEYAGRAIGA